MIFYLLASLNTACKNSHYDSSVAMYYRRAFFKIDHCCICGSYKVSIIVIYEPRVVSISIYTVSTTLELWLLIVERFIRLSHVASYFLPPSFLSLAEFKRPAATMVEKSPGTNRLGHSLGQPLMRVYLVDHLIAQQTNLCLASHKYWRHKTKYLFSKCKVLLGSGCGTVGRAVPSGTGDPKFKTSRGQFCI